jgi:hypothetical protein
MYNSQANFNNTANNMWNNDPNLKQSVNISSQTQRRTCIINALNNVLTRANNSNNGLADYMIMSFLDATGNYLKNTRNSYNSWGMFKRKGSGGRKTRRARKGGRKTRKARKGKKSRKVRKVRRVRKSRR